LSEDLKICPHEPRFDGCRVGCEYTADQCRVCWLWHHDLAHRQLWEAQPRRKAGPCSRLGGPTGERVRCPGCCGHVEIRLMFCRGSFGKTTVFKDLRRDPAAAAGPARLLRERHLPGVCPRGVNRWLKSFVSCTT